MVGGVSEMDKEGMESALLLTGSCCMQYRKSYYCHEKVESSQDTDKAVTNALCDVIEVT
jgi:hypothetical protein